MTLPFGSASPADPRDKTFHIKNGVKIYGGFSASTPESTLPARNISTNVTTLSGDFNGNDATSGSGATLSITGNTENAYHVVLASAASGNSGGVTIDGFTIKGGNANLVVSAITVNGNGITRGYGGGIYTFAGTNTISNNTLSGNKAGDLGGGIYTQVGTNTISNNTLSGNIATYSGGGILTYEGTNTISNNTLSGNTVTYEYGGGIHTYEGTNTLSNNTLSGNTATYESGGGISTGFGTNTLSNNTLWGNSAVSGGGIFTGGGTNTLSNNIFWGNKKGAANNVAGADYIAAGTNGNTFKNNLLQLAASSNYAGANSNGLGTAPSGNLFNQDPLFVSATDLRLQATSPCINKGIIGTGIPTTDITGATRTGNPDLGAYEYFPPCTMPSITTAASSNSPICAGAALNLSVAASGTAPLTYAWSGTGTFTNGTTTTPSVTGAATGNYVVTVSNSCGMVTSTVAVTVNAAVTPSVTITANQTNPITLGSNVTFTAAPVNGGTAPTYQWNGNAATTSNTYMDATLVDGDIVNCLMTSNAACAFPTTATSNTIDIETCNCSPTCSPIPTAADTYDGAIAYTDGNGMTHYCDNKGKLLLSTKPVTAGATTVILPSAVQIKIGTSAATFYPKWCGGTTSADKCFMVKTPATGGNVLINRWWHINDAQVTGTAISASNLLEISTYFTSTEFIALQNQMTTNSVIPALTSPTSLIFYQPMKSSVLLKFADPALVKPMTFHKVTNGTSAGQYNWLHDPSVSDVNKATFHVNTIKHSGGIGLF